MDSVNLQTLAPERSDYERSDICAVPAASVVAENVVAFELTRALLSSMSVAPSIILSNGLPIVFRPGLKTLDATILLT